MPLAGCVTFNVAFRSRGENIRRAGEDIRAAPPILAAGTRSRRRRIGLAASVGLAALPVFRRLRVALFFTGDELAMPGEPLKPGGIYNSNRFSCAACSPRSAARSPIWASCRMTSTPPAPRCARHRPTSDLIVTSGGVSVGEEDHVKPAVQAEGALDLWKIAIKPGKPLAFGRVGRRDTPFIGLPGNPVACFVTFLMLVRPSSASARAPAVMAPAALMLRADFDWPRAGPPARVPARAHRRRRRLDVANQGSGVLTSTHWADGLVDNPPGQAFQTGDVVRYLPLSGLLT
jgi:molybdopterin molybdotransferase